MLGARQSSAEGVRDFNPHSLSMRTTTTSPCTVPHAVVVCCFLQTMYSCGPTKPPLPGELRAVDVVERIKVRRHTHAHTCTHMSTQPAGDTHCTACN